MATIGSTRPSSQPLRGSSPRLDPDAFGAGVGRAIQNLAGSVDDFAASREALDQAYKARADKTERFNTLTRLNEWEGGIKRDLTELQRNAPAGGTGFTNQAAELIKLRREEFMAEVSEAHREEFNYRTSVFEQNALNTAFATEQQLGDQHFNTVLTQRMTQAQGEVYENPDRFEEHTEEVLALIDASALDANKKAELAIRTQQLLGAALAKKEFELSALVEANRGPADGSDVVAGGMPAISRGFLNGVASVEAVGYNVLNGGATFDGYAVHPAELGIKGKDSTAAGRYQFILGTWREAQAALNLPDFSPESQDKAAWWLAQRDYKRRTGRDLYQDLMTGDRAAVINAKRVLAGTGSGKQAKDVTWEGLQKMTDDAWANYVLGGRGARKGPTPDYPEGPDLFDDPRFAAIPFEEKLSLAADGERIAAGIKSEQIKNDKAAYDAYINEFRFDVLNGDRGIADIRAAQADGFIRDAADYEKLINLWEEGNNKTRAVSEAAALLSSGGVFRPGNPDHMKGLNGLVELDNGLERIANQDAEYVTQALAPLVDRAQVIPDDVLESLEGMIRQQDPRRVAFGYETMAQLEEASPDAFRFQVPDAVYKDYLHWQGLRDFMPMEEVVGRIRNQREFRQERQIAAQQADEALKEIDLNSIVDEFDPAMFSFGDPSLPTIPQRNLVFEREFQALFRDSYTVTGDGELAREAAVARMKKKWAPTDIGGTWRLMKHPPETSGYTPVGGSMAWVEEQVRSELGVEDEFQLIADTQTAQEIDALRGGQRQNLPSYLVFKKNQFGEWAAVMGDTAPVRWRGDPTPFVEQEVAATVDRTAQLRLRQLQEERAFIADEDLAEFDKEYERLVNELRAPAAEPLRNSRGKVLRDPTGRVIQ